MKKHILIGLCVVSVIVLIIQITYTYSLFETDRDAVVVSPIAKWNVLVNNINVTYNLSQQNSFVLGGVNWQSGNHVRAGKAAPGSVGTFEINVDPTDTEVSFLYEITIDTSGFLNDSFYISSVRELNNNQFIRTGENTYVGIASLSDIQNNTVYHIEIDISWANDDNNNDRDYALGILAEDTVNIPVTLRFLQYTGSEVITPYVPPSDPEEDPEEGNG